jgi:hypothetical protein
VGDRGEDGDPLEAEDTADDQQGPDLPPTESALEDSGPEYTQDQTLSYLAYLLKEAELTRARLDRIQRNTSVMIGLLAIAVIVVIIVWLDITGSISIF